MTMPHLENCPHDENGWCLDCVKKLHDEAEQNDAAYRQVLPVMYAAEEFAAGRIKPHDFLQTYAAHESSGKNLASRLLWLEDENKSLQFEIEFLRAMVDWKASAQGGEIAPPMQGDAQKIWETSAANHLRNMQDKPPFTSEEDGDKRTLGTRGVGVSWKVWRSIQVIVKAYLREHPSKEAVT